MLTDEQLLGVWAEALIDNVATLPVDEAQPIALRAVQRAVLEQVAQKPIEHAIYKAYRRLWEVKEMLGYKGYNNHQNEIHGLLDEAIQQLKPFYDDDLEEMAKGDA